MISSIKKSISLLFTLFFLSTAFAQLENKTPSNAAQLRQLANELSQKDAKDKEKALQKGIVIHEISNDGKIIGFVRFGQNGRPIFYQGDNIDAAATVSTDRVWPNGGAGYSLTGNGIDIGEWDGGEVRSTHVELINRVTQIDNPSSLSNHATHVAGTMIATGIDSDAKGMAYEATISAHDFFTDNSEMATYAQGVNTILSNHSYGTIVGWRQADNGDWRWYGDTAVSATEDYLFGFYSAGARAWDLIANNAPYYLIVKSAGNDRNDDLPTSVSTHYYYNTNTGNWEPSTTSRPADCPTGYDCIATDGNAKNILTVGAVNDIPAGYSQPSNVVMSSFSGWGPTDDGRIKPDIVANGVSLYSANSSGNSDYGNSSGTSMSAPNATGSLALIQEHYNDSNNAFLRSATLKGLVIHTADEAGTADGPDYSFGWGLLNTERAINTISDTATNIVEEKTLNDGLTDTIMVYSDGLSPLWVTIAWNDPAANIPLIALDPVTSMLTNDLDLRVIDASSTTTMPYTLNPAMPSVAASTGDNVRDNVEKVYIANPTAGFYTIVVSHKGSLVGTLQDYALILSGKSTPPVSTPPVAAFTPTTSTICAGDSIQFFDQSTNTPTSWTWSITGPVTINSTLQNPIITFPVAGTYSVNFVATNSGGSSSTTFANSITVNAAPAISIATTSACVNDTAFVLNIATPSGGTYTGTGITNNIFTPAIAGIGTHPVTYTVSSGGCSSTASSSITVNGTQLTVNNNPTVCLGSLDTLAGSVTPLGGTYIGPGVTSGIFNSVTAGLGTHTIYYGLVDFTGCVNVDSIVVTVVNAQGTSLSPFSSVCSADNSFSLSGGSPAGGFYSGPGVNSTTGIFDPALAGIGSHQIIYTLNTGSCVSADTQLLEVFATPSVSHLPVSDICLGAGTIDLSSYGTPSGGVYTGTGITGNLFDPAVAGVGQHAVTYTYTNPSGCADDTTIQITVISSLTVAMTDTVLCESSGAFTLNGGFPSGGSYSGAGVVGSQFDPSVAGVGTHPIIYSYSQNGCSGVATGNYVVNPSPVVSMTSFADVCVNQFDIILTGGLPVGGNYSGTGVSNGLFSPSIAGLGVHTITYSFTNSDGCTESANETITVTSGGNVQILGISDSICQNDSPIQLTGSPSGGTFSGLAMVGDIFDPALASIGSNTINYAVVGICADSTSKNIVVFEAPTINIINGPNLSFTNQSHGYFVPANNGSSYAWSVTNGTLLSTNNNVVQIEWGTSSFGEIQVVETNNNGCSDTATLRVDLWPLSSTAIQREQFVFQPYEEDGIINVKISSEYFEEGTLSVIGLDGKQYLTKNISTENGIIRLTESSRFTSGVYILQYKSEKRALSLKLPFISQ